MTRDTERLAYRIRSSALEMVARARAAHIGSALSISDVVAVLYGSVLRFDATRPDWTERDRFILSKGHACVAVYAALAEAGFFPIEWLDTYGAPDSPLLNHISHMVPGVEFSTGSLGHGLPFATGKALRLRAEGRSCRVFVLLSDGELDEGSNWEAMMFAAHHELSNLTAIVDANNLQSLDTVENTLRLAPLADKISAFGWAVRDIDGHSHQQLAEALSSVPWAHGKPGLVIARTTKGKGVPFMENRVEWHYRAPDHQQLQDALSGLERDLDA